MKSDKEFIRGIYIKASLLSEDSKKVKQITYRKWAPVLVVCLLAIICIPAYVALNTKKKEEPPIINDTDNINLVEPHQIDMRGMSIVNIISGEVKEIEEVDGISYALVNVEKTYEGSMDGKVSVVYDTPEILKNDKIEVSIGEKVLMFVEENIQEDIFLEKGIKYGRVVNGIYGKYTFIKNENGDTIYEASDGHTIASSELGMGIK